MKKILSTIFTALFALTLLAVSPVFAVDEPYYLAVECKVNDAVPEDTSFVFSVTRSKIDVDDNDNFVFTDTEALKDFTVKGKTKYDFGTDNELKHYSFKLKSCSDKTVKTENYEITVNFYLDGNVKTEFLNNGVPDGEQDFADEPANITVSLTTAVAVKISTDGCEAVTKIYDGKTDAVLTDKNYKLVGVADGHDVKLGFEKAEYNSADVKKANKVTLSELKLTGTDADKYALSSDKAELKGTVTARPLTVTADNLVMTVGQPEPPLTYTLSEPLIDGNKTVGALARAQGNAVGTYAVTRGTLSFGDNYNVTFVDGSLTVSNYSFADISDPATGVKISGYFDSASTVTVSAVDPQSKVYSSLAAGTGWGKIVYAYDIGFSAASTDGNVEIAFPVDSKYEGQKIIVYQQKSDETVSIFSTVVKDGTVTLSTDEVTQFMLVASDDEKADTEKSSAGMTFLKVIIIVLASVIGIGLLLALIFFGMIFFNKTEELKKIIKALKKLFKKK